jgi:hypothetical protein
LSEEKTKSSEKCNHQKVKRNGKKDVWEVIDEKKIPINHRCIKNKWIFKVKRNGIFRAEIVACGYSQVQGIDFNENFSPIMNHINFRIMLIAKLFLGYELYCG